MVKQRMKCIKAAAPVVLHGKIEAEVARAAVDFINNFPNSKHPTLTPRILVEGTKLTIDSRDQLIPFGTVAH